MQLAAWMNKDLIIQVQQKHLLYQAQLIEEQKTMIKMLEARIEVLENNQKKDSTNSNNPPSSDIGKAQRTKSLRTISGKRPGGQHGHSGQTLTFSSTPNEVVIHRVKQCHCCGKSLTLSPVVDYERPQVFDLPAIQMLITEHKSEIRSCAHCHAISKAVFPPTVSQVVQYGSNVQQLAVYFTHYQLLPYHRTAEIFKDLFGHALSSSFLVNTNQRCAVNLQPFIEDLKTKLLCQPVLHADESGFYFEGQRNWLHTVSTEKHSFYAPHKKRGTEAMGDINILPAYKGTLVHDFWKSYHDFECSHALCNVHHLQDLTFCHEVEKSNWAGLAKQLLLDLYEKASRAKEQGATVLSKGQLQYWSRKYDSLMEQGLRMHPVASKQKGKRGIAKKSKTQNMIKRFVDYKDQILAFAKNFLIPFLAIT
jgi:transposase